MAQKESYPRISKIFYITCLDPFKRPNVSTQHYFYDHITVSLRATVPLIQKRQREILRKPNAMGSWRESRKGGKKKKMGKRGYHDARRNARGFVVDTFREWGLVKPSV